MPPHPHHDSSGDENDPEEMICTSWHEQRHRPSPSFREKLIGFASGASSRVLKTKMNKTRSREKLISTKPGDRGAGETETEVDEPPRHLPTTRKIPLSGPLIPPNTLQQRLTPLLFEFSRLLAIVPAVVGFLVNSYHVYRPPDPNELIDGRKPPERVDYIISTLWALLTGYQALSLTTGLLTRWRLYYPPLATLIRLLALQAICWPATHFTLEVLEVGKRPVVVWAVVGSTTCVSRSVQIWVTSNLWWEGASGAGSGSSSSSSSSAAAAASGSGNISTAGSSNINGGGLPGAGVGVGGVASRRRDWQTDWQIWRGGKWGGRRWDWTEVVWKCMLPAGVVYFVMAWAEVLRRELSGC